MARRSKNRGKQAAVARRSIDEGNSTMFCEEQLKAMDDFYRGPDYVEMKCGCSSRKYGDTMGKLKVFANGKFVISCDCTPGCDKERLTPDEFEGHSGRPGNKKWTDHIWVVINSRKVPLRKTVLLKYYKHSTNDANGTSVAQRKRNFHRDEFIKCTKCNKTRRFRLRTRAECRIYHDAVLNRRWRCANRPYDRITCKDEEERESRRLCRGCPRMSLCKGCTTCVCFGCFKCRYSDCICRTCVDFMQNAEP